MYINNLTENFDNKILLFKFLKNLKKKFDRYIFSLKYYQCKT